MTFIYHITHADNLPSIVQEEGLWCDNEMARRTLSHLGIALAVGVAALAAITAVATGSAPRLLANALAPVAARLGMAAPIAVATSSAVAEGAQVEVHLSSVPAAASIVLDSQVLGMTPATITISAGQSLVLRRPGVDPTQGPQAGGHIRRRAQCLVVGRQLREAEGLRQ